MYFIKLSAGKGLYDKAFENFCVQTIEQSIIDNKEVLFLGQLLNDFIKCVQAIIVNVHVTCQAAQLKKRILKRCPDIVFHPSKTARTLVYVDSVTAGDVANELTNVYDTDDTDTDDDDGAPEFKQTVTTTPLSPL